MYIMYITYITIVNINVKKVSIEIKYLNNNNIFKNRKSKIKWKKLYFVFYK